MKSFPPVVQLLLTVQFHPPASSLTVLDWANLRAVFADELPIFTQVPRAGPMPARLEQLAVNMPFGLPRLSMASSDLSKVVMVQDDRISVGWQRTTPLTADPNYPGFAATLKEAERYISKYIAFTSEHSATQMIPVIGELTYTDGFLVNIDGVQVKRIDEIFTCFNSSDNFRFNRLQLLFQRAILTEQGQDFDGMLETTISGFDPTPDGQVCVNMQSVIRFEFGSGEVAETPSKFEMAHKLATDVFSTLVKPGASAILEPL